MNDSSAAVALRLANYRRKAVLLRQIASDNLAQFQQRKSVGTVVGVLLTGSLAALALIGTSRLRSEFLGGLEEETIELLLSWLAFIVFAATVISAGLRYDERISRSFRSVVVLSQFIADIDDYVGLGIDSREPAAALDQFRERYKTIIEVLPPNTDKEYVKAKRNLEAKQRLSHTPLPDLPDEPALAARLEELVMSSEWRREVLVAIRDHSSQLWVGGGFVRSAVWNAAHDRPDVPSGDDIDVIWFEIGAGKSVDQEVEAALRRRIPGFDWEVKNQARIPEAIESPYASLEEAIEEWPERCTAVLLRLDDSDDLEVLAPYGLTDLFNLIVRPTPEFGRLHPERYHQRIVKKGWHRRWPDLAIVYPESSIKRFRIPNPFK